MVMKNPRFSETVLLQGHIIDSLTFSKVLDRIMEEGARFTIQDISVGQRKFERSHASLEVEADSQRQLDTLLKGLRNLGAEVLEKEDVKLARAPRDGFFQKDFIRQPIWKPGFATAASRWIKCRGKKWMPASASR